VASSPLARPKRSRASESPTQARPSARSSTATPPTATRNRTARTRRTAALHPRSRRTSRRTARRPRAAGARTRREYFSVSTHYLIARRLSGRYTADNSSTKERLRVEAVNIKEEARRLIEKLPDDATWDDVMHEIYVR